MYVAAASIKHIVVLSTHHNLVCILNVGVSAIVPGWAISHQLFGGGYTLLASWSVISHQSEGDFRNIYINLLNRVCFVYINPDEDNLYYFVKV